MLRSCVVAVCGRVPVGRSDRHKLATRSVRRLRVKVFETVRDWPRHDDVTHEPARPE